MIKKEQQSRYLYSSKNWWIYDPKYYVLNKINEGSNLSVLDVGCSYGDFGIKMKEKGCTVDGVDFYLPAIEYAKQVIDNVYLLNLNELDNVDSKIKKKYDVITFMDVLEHCIEPESLLKIFKNKLKEGGIVYVSIPNVANIYNRLQLLIGNWKYEEYGVLDMTHLRFFTKETAFDLVQNVFPYTRIIAYSPRIHRLKGLERIWPELFALHFVLEGKIYK